MKTGTRALPIPALFVALAVGLSAPQTTQAQGTTYLSNLGETSSGSIAAGSDSWLAAKFATGTNSAGYILNWVQIEMTATSGAPNGFTLMICTNSDPFGTGLGGSIGSLSGSPDPATAGAYTYTSPPGLILSRQHVYFIVLTAATPVASGAYQWSLAGVNSYNPDGEWNNVSLSRSSDGASLNYLPGAYPQFAINATQVPEPGVSALLAFGGLCFLLASRESKAPN